MKKYLLLATAALMVMFSACGEDPVTPSHKPGDNGNDTDTVILSDSTVNKYIPKDAERVDLAYICYGGHMDEQYPVYYIYFATKDSKNSVVFEGKTEQWVVNAGTYMWNIQLISMREKNGLPSASPKGSVYKAAYDPNDKSNTGLESDQLTHRSFVIGYNGASSMPGLEGQEAAQGSYRIEQSEGMFKYKYIDKGSKITISKPEADSDNYLYVLEFEYSDMTTKKLAYYGPTPRQAGPGDEFWAGK